MSSPELAKTPDLCILVGVLPITEFTGGLPAMGVFLGSWLSLAKAIQPRACTVGMASSRWEMTHAFLKRAGYI